MSNVFDIDNIYCENLLPSMPRKSPDKAGHTEQVDDINIRDPFSKLRQNAIERLVRDERHRNTLFDMHAIESSDVGILRRWVNDTFDAYERRRKQDGIYSTETPEYGALVKLLGLANLLKPSTRGDYVTTRVGRAEKMLGISSFDALERVLAEKCGYSEVSDKSPVHLTKGAGTNLGPYTRSQESERWKHIGMGDVLYHEIEDLLIRFIRPELQDDSAVQQFVHVLAVALQRALHAEWFRDARTEDSVVSEWEQIVPYCDLNRIFSHLVKPADLLKEVDETTRYRASAYYQDDSLRRLSLGTQQLLWEYQGIDSKEVERRLCTQKSVEIGSRREKLHKLRIRILNAKKNDIDHKEHVKLVKDCTDACEAEIGENAELDHLLGLVIAEINKTDIERGELKKRMKGEEKDDGAKEKMKKIGESIASTKGIIADLQRDLDSKVLKEEDEVPKNITERCGRLVNCASISSVGELLELLNSFVNQLLEKSKEIKRAAIESRSDESTKCSAGTQYVSVSMSPHSMLGRVFTEEFCDGILRTAVVASGAKNIDLNKCVVTHVENFVPCDFEDMTDMFPEGSILLMDAVRSDSHVQDDERFFEGLKDAGKLLAPGGMYVTDGGRASYTAALRIPNRHIGSGVKYRVLMDGKTHNPLSIVVCKRHPTHVHQFMIDDPDITNTLGEDTYLCDVSQIPVLRPDLVILDRIRRKYAVAVRGNEEAHAGVQGSIVGGVHEHLVQECARISIDPELLGEGVSFSDLEQLALSIRKKVLSVCGTRFKKKRKADPESYGSPDAIGNFSAKTLKGFTIKEIQRKMMELYSADAGNPHVVSFYRDAISQWAYAVLCEMWHPSPHVGYGHNVPNRLSADWFEDRATQRANEELMLEELLPVARNVPSKNSAGYDHSPAIGEDNIDRICALIEAELHDVVMRHSSEGHRVISGTIERLSPSNIHVFPHLVDHPSPLDQHFEMPAKEQPDNIEFFGEDADARLAEKHKKLRSTLSTARERLGGGKPLLFLTFTDCATNILLRDKMKGMLKREFGDSVEELKIDMRDSMERKSGQIAHAEDVVKKLNRFLKNGGIVLGGGSWWDTYVKAGGEFKEKIGLPILKAIRLGISGDGPPVFFGGICFSSQFMGDLIGADEETSTKLGGLEFGPTGIRVFKDNPIASEIFDTEITGRRDIAVAMTHSGHLCGREFHHRGSGLMVPLANSLLTKNPVAWSAEDDRSIGLQLHPELEMGCADDIARGSGARISTDVEMVMKQLEAWEDPIRQTFGASMKDIRHNWELGQQHIIGDAGPHILANLLIYLGRNLNESLAS